MKREGKKRKVPDAHARACALSPAPLHGRVVNPGAPPDVDNEERSGLNNVFAGKPEKPVTRKENDALRFRGGVKSNILLPSLFKSVYICIP